SAPPCHCEGATGTSSLLVLAQFFQRCWCRSRAVTNISGRSPRLERRYCGQGSRSHDARATDCGGKALAHGDPGTPGQHRTRALLASPGALGPPSRDDRPVVDDPDMAGVSPGLYQVPTISGSATP